MMLVLRCELIATNCIFSTDVSTRFSRATKIGLKLRVETLGTVQAHLARAHSNQ
jgi:hypothetical protein